MDIRRLKENGITFSKKTEKDLFAYSQSVCNMGGGDGGWKTALGND